MVWSFYMYRRSLIAAACWVGLLSAQDGSPFPSRDEVVKPEPRGYVVKAGTKVLLSLIRPISTKHSVAGEQAYLETAFPVMADGKVVIPPHSYVSGTVTQLKKPAKVKGRGEIYIRFDSLTLPNGVTREFRARVSGLDGDITAGVESEGKIEGDSNKAGDLKTVGEATGVGASIGGIAGSAAGHAGMGLGIGAAAGAAAGLIGVLVTPGKDVVLARGTTVEMVLDRNLRFDENEIDFRDKPARNNEAGQAAPRNLQY